MTAERCSVKLHFSEVCHQPPPVELSHTVLFIACVGKSPQKNMKFKSFYSVAALFLVTLAISEFSIIPQAKANPGPTPSPTPTKAIIPRDVRDYPYGEAIPDTVGNGTLTEHVFNTLGYNTCPTNQWDTITESNISTSFNQQYNGNSTNATINGRRHWVMDTIVNNSVGTNANTNTLLVNGLWFGLQALLTVPVGAPTIGQQPYVVNTVDRYTTYTFKEGRLVYELTDPSGNVYVAQSYSQQIDRSLTLAKLPFIAYEDQLPEGWTYQARTLPTDLVLTANGATQIVNDHLRNTFQLNPGTNTGQWDHIVGGIWYIPPVQMTAYIVGENSSIKTRIMITNSYNLTCTSNQFHGPTTVGMQKYVGTNSPGTNPWVSIPSPTNSTMSGSITPEGVIDMIISSPAQTIGPDSIPAMTNYAKGHMVVVSGQWRMTMQTTLPMLPDHPDLPPYILQWANMTKLAQGHQMPPFNPALAAATLRSDNWAWLANTSWSVQDTALYSNTAETFQITDYEAGYFFGKSLGSDPFWVSGDVAPDGSLYLVFSAPSNPVLNQCGLIAKSNTNDWYMSFNSYPQETNGPTDSGYAKLTQTNIPAAAYSTILGNNDSVTGVRGYDAKNNVLLTGSYLKKTAYHLTSIQGMWWLGSLDNGVGAYYTIAPKISNEVVTSSLFYGPNTALFNPSLGAGNVRIVGSYQNSQSTSNNLNHGLIYTGPLNGKNGTWARIDVPTSSLTNVGVSVANTIPHSTMGNLVVGNYDMAGGLTNTGNAFIYNIASNNWTIFSPTNSGTAPIGTTAYGIWQNGSSSTSYTIAGGALTNGTNTAFLVDYNSATGSFTNLTYFPDPAQQGLTHFEGITQFGSGYNLVATTANGPAYVSIGRTEGPGSAFGSATWTPITYPGSWLSTGNTVFKNYGLGIYIGAGLPIENSYVVRIGPKQ